MNSIEYYVCVHTSRDHVNHVRQIIRAINLKSRENLTRQFFTFKRKFYQLEILSLEVIEDSFEIQDDAAVFYLMYVSLYASFINKIKTNHTIQQLIKTFISNI